MKTTYLATTFLTACLTSPALGQGSWDRFYTLRDDTNTWTDGKPSGGWYVTGIHQNLLPSGEVLITGWGRSSEFACVNGNGGQNPTSRRWGVSFVLNPVDVSGGEGQPHAVLNVQPINEAGRNPADVLYCSGHATLPDSTKLFFGGSTYENLGGGSNEKEYGLDYARVFEPSSNTYRRVPETSPLGTSWYPTLAMLSDERILIVRGFSQCCGDKQVSDVGTFDYYRHKNGQVDPWQLLLDDSQSRNDIKPGLKDYTRVWVLPEPVTVDGVERQVVMMGAAGKLSFFNTDRNRDNNSRFTVKPNSARPGNCGWDSTGAILSTGELMVAGGCRNEIDLYNPATDQWRSFGMGITRHTPSSVLLPDGNVLIINGENPSINQDNGQGSGGNPRTPQVFDPWEWSIQSCNMEPNDGTASERGQSAFRGYHNSVSLLMDGRILVSGGVHKHGDIGCEQPNLRIFTPPYLETGNQRPRITSMPNSPELALSTEDSFLISFSGSLWPSSETGRSGVVLMAFGSQTHSYDQAQRYVPLRYELEGGGKVRVFAPREPRGIPGDYTLFLVSDKRVPSIGKHVRVTAARGDYLRTVIYIKKETESGQQLYVRGGHDGSVVANYGGKDSEPIIHANLVGENSDRANDLSLDWSSDSGLSWTASQGSSPYHDSNKIYYATTGAGIDPENDGYGQHWWKFEVYMPKDDTNTKFSNYFEFKAVLRNADGSLEWEPNMGAQAGAPAATGNHWAKKGSVTKVVFGSNDVEMYDLNEPAIPVELVGSRNEGGLGVVAFTKNPAVVAGISVGGVALAASLVALVVVRNRRTSASATDTAHDEDVNTMQSTLNPLFTQKL